LRMRVPVEPKIPRATGACVQTRTEADQATRCNMRIALMQIERLWRIFECARNIENDPLPPEFPFGQLRDAASTDARRRAERCGTYEDRFSGRDVYAGEAWRAVVGSTA